MNSYRQQMPPMSYLTLLDQGLIVNLALIAFCVLVVVASAVAHLPFCLLLDYFILHQIIMKTIYTFISLVYESETSQPLGRETGAGT